MKNDLNFRKEEECEYRGRSRSRSREAQHDEMTNILLNRIIDLEVRVKYLEEENKKQKIKISKILYLLVNLFQLELQEKQMKQDLLW